jgi:hypothetical protein
LAPEKFSRFTPNAHIIPCVAPFRPPVVGRPASLTAPLPQDVIELARSTFTSLQNTTAKDIVTVGFGTGIPLDGAEILERSWEGIYGNLNAVTISFRHGMYPLVSEAFMEDVDPI